MAKPTKPSDKTLKLPTFVDLPVLTEEQVTDTTVLPVLTEALAPELPMTPAAKPGATPLSEAQYKQIAQQIAPQLEALLREKLAARLGTIWTEIWREAQAELPKLIRAELEKPAPRSRK